MQIVKLIIFDCDGILLPDFEMDKYKRIIEHFLRKHDVINKNATKKEASAIIKEQNMAWKKIEKKVLTGKLSHRQGNAIWIKELGLKRSLIDKYLECDYEFWRKSVKSVPWHTEEIRETLKKLKSKKYNLYR